MTNPASEVAGGDAAEEASRPLHVALAVDSLPVPRWIRRLVEAVASSPSARVAAVLVAGSEPRRLAARSLYARADAWLGGVDEDALAPASLDDLLPPSCIVRLDGLGAGVVPQVLGRGLDLDLVVDLSSANLASELCGLARAGALWWSAGSRPGPPGFWEVLTGEPVTTITLHHVDPDRCSTTLRRSCIGTDRASVRRNQNRVHWKAGVLIQRELERIWKEQSAGGHASPFPVAAKAAASGGGARSSGQGATLSTVRAITLAARTLLGAGARKVAEKVSPERWAVLYSASADLPANGADDLDLSGFRELAPRSGAATADPHLWIHDGTPYLFFEEIPRGSRRGHIAVSAYRDGRWSPPALALAAEHHLSHPFLFAHAGALFMIPESGERRTVDLYRCVRFPDGWVHERTLLSGVQAADATLLRRSDRWWMFLAIAQGPGATTMDELYLFHSDDPVHGEWKPHARNPVVTDVRHARPAGPFLHLDGHLIRPAQDCSTRYGRAVRLMRVEQLDERAYRESEWACIAPRRGSPYVGIHSVAVSAGLVVMDGRRREWRFAARVVDAEKKRRPPEGSGTAAVRTANL